MKTIDVYYGRTGAGKSTRIKENVRSRRGRHLFVAPRCDSVLECYDDLEKLQTRSEIRFDLYKYSSKDGRKGGPITKRIADKAAEYCNEDHHCCIIITQAAFLLLGPSVFMDWHLHLDELLTNGVTSGEMYAPVMMTGLASIFELQPAMRDDGAVSTEISRIAARPDIKHQDVLNDSHLLPEEKNLFQRALAPYPVYIEATSMTEIAERKCRWFSAWTLDETASFASVEIAACDIEDSLMHLLSPHAYNMIEVKTPPSKAKIHIRYFDNGGATCSSDYWETPQGVANLKIVASYISANGGVDYWTCNTTAESILKPLMPQTGPRRTLDPTSPDGTWVPQQQDGTNALRDCESCAIFASAKAQAHERIFAEISCEATMKAITHGREGGLLWQFASRGRPRCAGYDGTYTVWVWDRHQAERLRTKYDANGFPDVNVEHVDVPGFQNRVRAPVGAPTTYKTLDERNRAKREKGRLRQQKHRAKAKADAVVSSKLADQRA